MKLFKKVKEIRSKNGELHFTRFAIIETKFFSVYIHKIYKKDEDEYLHNHPWNFFSLILWNGYLEKYLFNLEEKLESYRYKTVGSFGFYNGQKDFHKLYAVIKPTTTLVITGSRYNNWGYLTGNNEIISNEQYRQLKHGE